MTTNNRDRFTSVKTFSTYDLGLASALVSKGQSLIGLENSRRGKTRFVFDSAPEIEEIAGRYWDNNLKICARTFFENQKMLKSRIYSDQL